MHEGVSHHAIGEVVQLVSGGELSVQQQVRHLQKGRLARELLHWDTTIQQDACALSFFLCVLSASSYFCSRVNLREGFTFVSVDPCNARSGRSRVHEARIVQSEEFVICHRIGFTGVYRSLPTSQNFWESTTASPITQYLTSTSTDLPVRLSVTVMVSLYLISQLTNA